MASITEVQLRSELNYHATLAAQSVSELQNLKRDKDQLLEQLRQERSRSDKDKEELKASLRAVSLEKEVTEQELQVARQEAEGTKAQHSSHTRQMNDSKDRALMIQGEIDDFDNEAQRKEGSLKQKVERLETQLEAQLEEAHYEKEEFNRTITHFLQQGLPSFESTE
jgi:chromosome segregation ATPase